MLRFRWGNLDCFRVVNLGRFRRVMFIRPYWVNFTVFSTWALALRRSNLRVIVAILVQVFCK